MTLYDFEVKYTTMWQRSDGIKMMFNPFHNKNVGSMISYFPDGRQPLGGEYSMREENGNLFIDFYGTEYLITFTHDGFHFSRNSTITDSFTIPAK